MKLNGVPKMLTKGMTGTQIDAVFKTNPQQVLAIAT